MPAGRRLPRRRPRLARPPGSTPTRAPALARPGRRADRGRLPDDHPGRASARSAPACCPVRHGLVGAAFRYPETGDLLTPLHWGSDPTPVAVQPEPTVFEAVGRGRASAMTTVSPGAYRDSGLTRAVLRGAEYAGGGGHRPSGWPPSRRPARPEARRSPTSTGRSSTASGTSSASTAPQWRDALARGRRAGRAAGRRAGPGLGARRDRRPRHGRLPPGDRDRDRGATAVLMAGVERIAGEPRARHLYVPAGCRRRRAGEPGARCSAIGPPSSPATSWSRRATSARSTPSSAERIGDVMAIARGNVLLASRVDSTVSPAASGSTAVLTDDELLIPASSIARALSVWHDVRVSELIFYAGTMDCGKSTLALQTDHNHALARPVGHRLHPARPRRGVGAVQPPRPRGAGRRGGRRARPARLRRRAALQRGPHRLPHLRRGPVLQRGAGRPAGGGRRRARHRRLRLRHHDRLPHPAVPGLGPPRRARRPRAGAAGRGAVLVRRAGDPQRAHGQRRDGGRGQPGHGRRHHDRARPRTVAYEVLCRTHYRSRTTAARSAARAHVAAAAAVRAG